jgi:enamine deaminase RidA (YjgF/YER057c/UK114 family)
MNIEKRIEELGYQLSSPPKPLAAYVPCVKVGNLIFTAGQVPLFEGSLKYSGKVPVDISEDDAIKSAEICALNCLNVIKAEIGDLDKINRIVKVTVFVNSSDNYSAQPKIANGASEFLVKVFGDAGKHARSAVGVSSLPLNAPVEVELIAELKE